jgi:glycosyltransferase involved in cell wall biosynthesis
MPYAVDNDQFQQRAGEAKARRESLRKELGLEPNRAIILYAAKFIPVKAPEDLLAAFQRLLPTLQTERPYLMFVGDGPLRSELEKQAKPLGDSVRFLGFRNQSEIPAFYDLCDVFVLPSHFEPWGLAVNEAMNAGKPVIVSDRVGAATDLVEEGGNGSIYPHGDAAMLAARLKLILESPELQLQMGRKSLERINVWNFEADYKGLLEALSAVCKYQKKAGAKAAL